MQGPRRKQADIKGKYHVASSGQIHKASPPENKTMAMIPMA
jgi:hypothetical protein